MLIWYEFPHVCAFAHEMKDRSPEKFMDVSDIKSTVRIEISQLKIIEKFIEIPEIQTVYGCSLQNLHLPCL